MHFARNILARVPKGHQDVVAVRPQFPKVKELMDSAKGDVLAFSTFPPDHWRKILIEQLVCILNSSDFQRRIVYTSQPRHRLS